MVPIHPLSRAPGTDIEGWRTLEVQRSKEPCIEICNLLRAKECSLGYIHATMPTSGKLSPLQRSSGLVHEMHLGSIPVCCIGNETWQT